MNLTLKVKLCPDDGQYQSLLTTMERFNDACNFIATVAFEKHMANKIKLQQLIYHDVRDKFGLSAQLAIRAIAKVVEVYKRDKNVMPKFKPYGAVVYDQRILSWKGIDRVSILSIDGRLIIPIVIYEYFKNRANRIRGQADLILVDNVFYLCVIVEVPDGAVDERRTHKVLGVDLGVVNLAVDSDGDCYTGKSVDDKRFQLMTLKARLQSCSTKSAKRHLKKLSGREKRFRTNVNHIISKTVVAKAFDTGRSIALEDLKGIRARTTVRRPQRDRHMKWAYNQLRQYIEYKAIIKGVPVIFVDPAYTSQTCPACGHISGSNRNGQVFRCVRCGHAGHADHIAAINIAGVAVNRPTVSKDLPYANFSGTSPPSLEVGS